MTAEKTSLDTDPGLEHWLDPKSWPTPKWCVNKANAKKIQTYESYYLHQIRTRYLELETDFRSVMGNFGGQSDIVDYVTAARIFEFLQIARGALEQKSPDLLAVSSMLDFADRYMVWLYPPHVARARANTALLRIESSNPPGAQRFIDQLTEISAKDESKLYKDAFLFGKLRAVLDEVIGLVNRQTLQDQMSSGLQIERLTTLRLWGIVVLSVALVVSPVATNLAVLSDWPSLQLVNSPLIAAWINALTIAILGAAGGFISGLLQARSSRVTFVEYQENMLKLQLKPLVGALVSLILYVLLSWQILPGIAIQNTGSYFLIAFLSGFSERYFLNLLDVKANGEDSARSTGSNENLESGSGDAAQKTPGA